jgi:predicted DsbA family dithiol-disulfide isomerase|nr:DsbA family oxidoreductase [Pseudomonas luteola]
MSTLPIHIDVWSDYVCPFCYLELPLLDQLKAHYGDRLTVTWHAFELRPDPIPTLIPDSHYLRSTWARAVYPMAEERGLTLRLPPMQPRSRRALEVAEHARQSGQFDAMHRGIFKAFFEQGRDIGRDDILLDIANLQGIDTFELGVALEENRHTQSVLDDEALAQTLGITAVPTLLIRLEGQAYEEATQLSGAVDYERLTRAVETLTTQR